LRRLGPDRERDAGADQKARFLGLGSWTVSFATSQSPCKSLPFLRNIGSARKGRLESGR
jgi:hypothetical protein